MTLSAEFLAELLKLVGRISLSRDTDTRKEWEGGRQTMDQTHSYILFLWNFCTHRR